MKNLYLLRHANTQPNTEGDKARILTPKGVKEVRSVVEQFLSKNITFDLVLCSIATRTKQTLHHFESFAHRNFYTEYKESLYNPTIEDFLQTIGNIPEHFSNVLVISHNPTTSEVANHLLDNGNMSFGTSNLAALELDINSWEELMRDCAKLKWLITPEL